MKDNAHVLYVIDISSFIFRAFYAVRELSNSKGEPTNAVFGVAQMLIALFETELPSNVVVAYDSKEPSFRKTQYDLYKANRQAPPEALLPQFARIESLISGLGLASIRVSGCEADDLIATLTRLWQALDSKHEVVIVTGDKDLMQLVNHKVSILDTLKQKLFKEAEVIEKFEIAPHQVRDYLALIGDSSDNIPGVPSIGPKTAVQLIKEHGTLDEIYVALEKGLVSGKKAITLKEHEKLARLSYELVTLKDELFSEYDFENAKIKNKSFTLNKELGLLLEELELRSLSRKLNAFQPIEDLPSNPSSLWVKPHFETVTSVEQLDAWSEKIREHKIFAFDFETTSLSPHDAEVVGISLCVDEKGACYIPVGHTGLEARKQLELKVVFEKMGPVFSDKKIIKLAQNSKYDLSILKVQGVSVSGITEDTMVADYILDPDGRHSLEVMADKYGGYKVMTYESVCGKGKDQRLFSEVSIEQATQYSAEDAWVTMKIWKLLEAQIRSDPGKQKIYRELDLPLVAVLRDMELQGICLDEARVKALQAEFQKEANGIETQVRAFSSDPLLNLQSPKQLAHFLFEELKLPVQSKTKTGYSTDASVLEALAPLHDVPRLLLEHRELMKLLGTYLDPVLAQRSKKTSRIHTHFHQASTSTGRLSSSNPNLQNIPIRTKRGERIRQLFVASPGHVLLAADYSQVELRILAELSQDTDLVNSFLSKLDIHKRTAADIYHVDIEAVTDDMRAVAKAINFGLMYGKTAFGLSQELNIPRSEAAHMIANYFERYSGVKRYLDGAIQSARDHGYVETVFGRRRYLRDIKSQNAAVRAMAERLAMNSPIQGTAADFMRFAMIDLHEALQSYQSKMLLQVHDEVVLECPIEEVAPVALIIKSCLEGAWMKRKPHRVPFTVNVSSGPNWLDQVELSF